MEDLAKNNNVKYQENNLDKFAAIVTNLSGDDVISDETKDLIIALKRAGVINNRDVISLIAQHIKERRDTSN